MYKTYSSETKKMPIPIDRCQVLAYYLEKGGIPMPVEKVLVVQTDLLNLPGNKYLPKSAETAEIMKICAENHCFIDRPAAEGNPAYKQLIPYVTIMCEDKILCLQRTIAQSEERLHGKISLGVGGHINPVDAADTLASIISLAMNRELREELWLETESSPFLSGLINDDSNSVGSVHLGIHYILPVETRPAVRETDKMKSTWLSPHQLEALRPRMETWSQILLPALEMADHL